MQHTEASNMGGFPRPGPALKGVLIGVFALWLVFNLTINWAPLGVARVADQALGLLVGNTEQVLLGQLWRLVTAAWLTSSLRGLFFALIGLYFLSPPLEKAWGSDRFLRFLLTSSFVAYGVQVLLLALLPEYIAKRLSSPTWFGVLPVVEAIAIAWAMSFRGQTVRLFFVLPVTGRQLIWIVVGMSLLTIIALEGAASGYIAPFGGMLSGWLLSGNPSTLRRFYLRMKLRRHERALAVVKRERSRRVAASGLRVIEGGRKRVEDSDDSDPDSGPDHRMLH